MPGIRILVAEDATLVRRLLVQRLAQEPGFEVVGEAADGRETIDLALSLHPDVVVMDLEMPHLNGMEVTERIRARHPETRVVIITAHESLVSVARFSGAAECLDKSCTPQELAAAIRRVHAASRQGTLGHATAAKAHETVDRLAARAGLTERERVVLEHVLQEELTNQQIANSLARQLNEPVSEAAVKHALQRLMRKLGVEPRTRAALVKHVLETGYEREYGRDA
jgi:DNA-binding NarL/FixJ family response regulator